MVFDFVNSRSPVQSRPLAPLSSTWRLTNRINLSYLQNTARKNSKLKPIKRMFEAIKNGDLELVREKLKSCKNLNMVDEMGSTPLDCAIYDRQAEIVKLLISSGANPNARDEDGATPLHLAVDRGALDIVELLIDNGAKVNVEDEDGTTPLYISIEEGFESIERCLRVNGAKR